MAKPSLVPRALAVALALSLSPPLYAASDAEVAEIREQIRQIRESYESRLQALEQRLKDAEAKAREAALIRILAEDIQRRRPAAKHAPGRPPATAR